MTTEEHLDLIVAKCRELLTLAETETCSHTPESVAAFKSTIAAITAFRRQPAPEGTYHPDNPLMIEDRQAIEAILAAWPTETLKP